MQEMWQHESKLVHYATLLGSFGILTATACDALGVAGRSTTVNHRARRA